MTTIESLEARQLLASVSVRGDDFLIDGRITHANSQLAGTLPNIRAANATFDDANPTTASKWKYPDTRKWDANRNTSEFIAQLPNWKKAGVLAVTLSFQGGGPVNNQFGPSQPWDSGAFNRDGSIRSAHLARMEKAIAALNANGMIAIVNYFYLGQENRLRDHDAAERRAEIDEQQRRHVPTPSAGPARNICRGTRYPLPSGRRGSAAACRSPRNGR